MDIFIVPFLRLLLGLVSIYIFVVWASLIISWLLFFGVLNQMNPTVRFIFEALRKLTAPPLARIRRIMPRNWTWGLDFSPAVLLLLLIFIQEVLARAIAKFYSGLIQKT